MNTTYISVGGFLRTDDDFASALIDTAAYMLNQTAPPQVMTTSYGDNENLWRSMFGTTPFSLRVY